MEIQKIKQRLSIQTVLKHYSLQTDKNGMLKCPFHADDTASMKIYPQTNTFNVGYNSGQFHHRGKLDEADTKACVDAGLLIPYKGSVPNANGTTYTAFAKDCIIFPIKDKAGNIVSLYGRSITNNDKSKHYYLKDRQGLLSHDIG